MYRATVYAPDGAVADRLFKGQKVGELTFDRAEARRAWLSARSAPDEAYPKGTTIKVSSVPKKIAGTALFSVPVVVYHRRWDGDQWVEVETGEPVE